MNILESRNKREGRYAGRMWNYGAGERLRKSHRRSGQDGHRGQLHNPKWMVAP